MRIVSNTDAVVLNHAGETYTAADDGTFEVPEAVGRELIGYPLWDEEYVVRLREAAAQREADNDAAVQAEKIRALEARVAALEEAAKPRRTRRTKAEIAAAQEPAQADDEADEEPDEGQADSSDE